MLGEPGRIRSNGLNKSCVDKVLVGEKQGRTRNNEVEGNVI